MEKKYKPLEQIKNIQTGKEKPLYSNFEELTKIIKLAKKNKCSFSEAAKLLKL